MFIQSFSYQANPNGTTISPTTFDKLNILVGTSGCGKTTMMKSLQSILEVAQGKSSTAHQWQLDFTIGNNQQCRWQGEINNDSGEFISEKLTLNHKVLIEKANGSTQLNGHNLPTLEKSKSHIALLKEDESINPIYLALCNVVFAYNDSNWHVDMNTLLHLNKQKLQNPPSEVHNPRLKIIKALHENKPLFDEFNFVYTSIFPQVKSVQCKAHDDTETPNSSVYIFGLLMNDGTKVFQTDISSGMFKTMMLLAELMFSTDDTLILIDELENSLGINCLPDIISEIKSFKGQCIVTTHHPRIINDISPKNWKVVSRTGAEIHVTPATEVIQSSSHHDKFIQLINSSIYQNGAA